MRLNPDARIRAVLDEINCNTLVDIGCDHGMVSVGALLENRADRVIAVDISEASLQKCRELGKKAKVEDKLDCRIGDGFTPVKEGEADFAVIAGMGGREIIYIMSTSRYNGRLLLLPHQDIEELRRFLSGKYDIEKDFTIFSNGRYYNLIAVSQGGYTYNEEEIYYGRNLPKTDAYLQMLAAEKDKLGKIVYGNGLKEGEVVKKLKEAEKLCQRYGI